MDIRLKLLEQSANYHNSLSRVFTFSSALLKLLQVLVHIALIIHLIIEAFNLKKGGGNFEF